ncbi:hypothetical protein ElyMa_003968000 [Elysia marginata]|uniref:Uncharacterized protein n=1 Tax=Elysia marginata TaxID=1093978 RepID=A0AAV4FW23_9GAST|nr:hypothetical protein ElyMa_003968000 [Elysia marginata]
MFCRNPRILKVQGGFVCFLAGIQEFSNYSGGFVCFLVGIQELSRYSGGFVCFLARIQEFSRYSGGFVSFLARIQEFSGAEVLSASLLGFKSSQGTRAMDLFYVCFCWRRRRRHCLKKMMVSHLPISAFKILRQGQCSIESM